MYKNAGLEIDENSGRLWAASAAKTEYQNANEVRTEIQGFINAAVEERKTAVKICPVCGETILAVAKKCKFCGERLFTKKELEFETKKASKEHVKGNIAILLIVVIVVAVVVQGIRSGANPVLVFGFAGAVSVAVFIYWVSKIAEIAHNTRK